ncbi:hypothetical protein Tco_1504841 [Tanacetum coccineum]
MSQSIPEQLNVDRREFADAVNALTKICSSHLVGSGAGIFSSAIATGLKRCPPGRHFLTLKERESFDQCSSDLNSLTPDYEISVFLGCYHHLKPFGGSLSTLVVVSVENLSSRLDEGMDQAGSGFAGLSSLEIGIDEAEGSNLEVVVVQAVYVVKAAVLDEPGACEP